MELHLFSNSGELPLQDIISASRPLLEDTVNPNIAYMPAGEITRRPIAFVEEAFGNIARVTSINIETLSEDGVDYLLNRTDLLYIPGGNTYLMSHRLHNHRLIDVIKHRVVEGLPLLASSAGTVMCGVNILTTNDINCCACTFFSGFNLVPYNFTVHYPSDCEEAQGRVDLRLQEYHSFFNNPIIALEDGAYLRVTSRRIELIQGRSWLFEQGAAKVPIEVGEKLKNF